MRLTVTCWAFALCALSFGCDDDDDQPAATTCTPGEQVACACDAGGGTGLALCRIDGEPGECRCTAPAEDAAVGCVDGATRCAGAQVELCMAGLWQASTTCPGGCEAGRCLTPADAASLDAATLDAAVDAAEPDAAEPDAALPEADAAVVLPTEPLSFACEVPFVLDASRTGDLLYMTSHFGHLVQSYCATGTVQGSAVSSYPEKMFYGTHAVDAPVLSFVQVSMAEGLSPQLTVKVDFDPDTLVTAGGQVAVGLEAGQAVAQVIRHSGAELCLLAVGVGGQLSIPSASGVTAVEGGAFHFTGGADMARPAEVPGLCEAYADVLACCP